MARIEKSLLGLAGEYLVAGEICRRGYHAQITFGRWKNTDILAVNLANGNTILVEVKSKQGREWPNVKGSKGKKRIQILVDFKGKGLLERPDFYIIDEGFRRKYLEKIKNKLKEIIETEEQIIPVWPDGWKGVSLRPEDVKEYKERWDILENKLRIT
ncbi:MAG: hypothetical protein J7L82_01285 [Staphylothermus sp.]|nr:hypothetical protein [Staphylothermus sp.]